MSPWTPLIDPARYFEERSDSLSGVGVFALHMILRLVGLYVGIRLVFDQVENLDPELERQVMSMVSGMLFFTAILLVVGWFIVAAIMHYGSGGSKTNGTFASALGVAGWAYAPEVVTFLPTFLYQRQKIQQLSFDGADPAQLTSEFQAMQNEMALSLVSIVVLFLVTAWSVYILAHGIAKTHDVSVDTAVIPAAAIGLGSILFTVLGSL